MDLNTLKLQKLVAGANKSYQNDMSRRDHVDIVGYVHLKNFLDK
jgi:hypothetical protein